MYTVEPPNNGHGGDKHFVHCLEVVPSSEVWTVNGRGKQFVHCREVVLLSEWRFYCILLAIQPIERFGKCVLTHLLEQSSKAN